VAKFPLLKPPFGQMHLARMDGWCWVQTLFCNPDTGQDGENLFTMSTEDVTSTHHDVLLFNWFQTNKMKKTGPPLALHCQNQVQRTTCRDRFHWDDVQKQHCCKFYDLIFVCQHCVALDNMCLSLNVFDCLFGTKKEKMMKQQGGQQLTDTHLHVNCLFPKVFWQHPAVTMPPLENKLALLLLLLPVQFAVTTLSFCQQSQRCALTRRHFVASPPSDSHNWSFSSCWMQIVQIDVELTGPVSYGSVTIDKRWVTCDSQTAVGAFAEHMNKCASFLIALPGRVFKNDTVIMNRSIQWIGTTQNPCMPLHSMQHNTEPTTFWIS